jgi:hypothetical protein
MKKNSSLPQFKGLNTISNQSSLITGINGQQKKLQGFDLSTTTKSNNTFSNKI